MKDYKEKKIYFNTLQKTETMLLVENNITKKVLTATYLRDKNARISDKNNEVFIVGLYFEGEEIGELSDIFEIRSISENNKIKTKIVQNDENNKTSIEKYTLKLNGKSPISVEKLPLSDPRLIGLTLISEWSTYALVTFKHEKNTRLTMTFKSPQHGSASANFSKVAKYIFTKTAF